MHAAVIRIVNSTEVTHRDVGDCVSRVVVCGGGRWVPAADVVCPVYVGGSPAGCPVATLSALLQVVRLLL